jgi:hypothetical protein
MTIVRQTNSISPAFLLLVLFASLGFGQSQSRGDPCKEPKDVGPCQNQVHRFFFNIETGMCEPMMYSGCEGNRNHFYTMRECEIYCVDPFFKALLAQSTPFQAAQQRTKRQTGLEFTPFGPTPYGYFGQLYQFCQFLEFLEKLPGLSTHVLQLVSNPVNADTYMGLVKESVRSDCQQLRSFEGMTSFLEALGSPKGPGNGLGNYVYRNFLSQKLDRGTAPGQATNDVIQNMAGSFLQGLFSARK